MTGSTKMKKVKMTKKKRAIVIASSILGVILILALVVFGITYSQLSKIKLTSIPKTNEGLGITQKVADTAAKAKITNIMLYGDDRLDKNENGRSDSMIVLSIDETNNKVKMCSIMRDSYVNIEGHGMDKLNHAFSYGGPALSIKTINQNYELDIKDYIKVDFDGLKAIVDYLGGVEIPIKSYELPGVTSVGITKAGTYNLSGTQALAYARIRYYGNNDYERTDRQRLVLSEIFKKIKAKGATGFPGVVAKILPYVETSLAQSDILSLGMKMASSNISNVEQLRLPLDNYKKDVTIDGVYYLQWDKQPNLDALHKFIWGEGEN
jgi:polyisoprenyl-teichoic acid--peptidoglycan teichoic acid transferase